VVTENKTITIDGGADISYELQEIWKDIMSAIQQELMEQEFPGLKYKWQPAGRKSLEPLKKERDKMDDLIGVNAICQFMNMSESTIMLKAQNEGLPIQRNRDAVWVANKKDLNYWLLNKEKPAAPKVTEFSEPEPKLKPKKRAGRPKLNDNKE
jgi:hypothetical protein